MANSDASIKTLGGKHPELIPYWDCTKNGKTPFDYGPSSHELVYWNFPHFSGKLEIRVVTMRPQRYIDYGVNSVGAHPVLSLFYSESNKREVLAVPVTSKRPVLWEDSHGNRHKTSPKVAAKNITGPDDDLAVVFSKKSLASENPELVELMWDHTKNSGDGVFPESVQPHSQKEVWWVCPHYNISYKRKVILQNKSGLRSPYQTGGRCASEANSLLRAAPGIEKFWSEKNTVQPGELTAGSQYRAILLDEVTGEEFERVVYDIPKYGFRAKRMPQRSKGERELVDWLLGLGVELLENDRKVIAPYELDVYIPGEKVAIEYNGLYWHGANSRPDKNCHYKKWKMCKDKGIQLLTVWEDDWVHKNKIVKGMLRHKLGLQGSKVYARNTRVITMSFRDAAAFLNEHHIQGASSSGVYYGLVAPGGEVVAVSAWRKSGEKLYLDRYATSVSVVGGAGKLLGQGVAYARSQGLGHIVTFSDHELSWGGLYEALGFTNDGDIPVDYKYVVGGVRKHKFGFRKKFFRENDGMKYRPGMTEAQLAALNGIDRVYDCGKTRWVLQVKDLE